MAINAAAHGCQSNGKIERCHKIIKGDAIRPGAPGNADEVRRIIGGYVRHYNTEHLQSAVNYVTLADRLAGRHLAIVAERDRKLEAARERRAECRREARYAGLPRASSPQLLDNHP
jgi:hypothetical protein